MISLRLAALAVAASFAFGISASANSNRTFVSAHGSDANPCSAQAPCRSFQVAHDHTNAGGEITVLDSAGYGAVTITKAISIVNDGVGEAGVTVTSGNAITINAGVNDAVELHGLTLVGSGTSTNGITLNSAGTLIVTDGSIRGFTSAGINLTPSASSNVAVINTVISNSFDGVFAAPTGGGTVAVSLDGVHLIGYGSVGAAFDGAASTGSLLATVSNSEASGGVEGVSALTVSGKAGPIVQLVNCRISNNSFFGIVSDGPGAIVLASQTSVFANGTGLHVANGGLLKSYGDNTVGLNNVDGSFTETLAKK